MRAARVALGVLLVIVGKLSIAASSAGADSMPRAADYLLASQLRSGFLLYGFDFLEDAPLEPRAMSASQLTRQALTAAFLADYYALTADRRAPLVISRLIEAFGRHSLPIGKSRAQELIEWTGLLSMPVGRWRIESTLNRYGLLYETDGSGKVLSPDTDYANAYAGATALALLAEVRYSRASGDNRFAPLRRAWLEGLVALRIPRDGFRQIPGSIDTHPYYDGEPWLGLTEYHRAFPEDRRVGEFLADVDVALMKKYANFKLEFFHWGVAAAAIRFAATKDPKYLDFTRGQLNQFLRRMESKPEKDTNCAAIEGAVDAMSALIEGGDRNSALFLRAMRWTTVEMEKAWRAQIQPGQTELVFTNARISAPRMREFAGSFRSGPYTADSTMNMTAHCLSAMVKMQRHGIRVGGA